MIREVSLSGFKSFVDETLSLNRLTLLTGLNSAGKSSVIQALRMLEKAVKNENNILLPGHGSRDEIKNPFVKDSLSLAVGDDKNNEFSATFSPQGDTKITGGKIQFPEIIYVSARRFGPQTSIPIYNDSSKLDRIGENGENVLQCIEMFENSELDECLHHENSEGDTLGFNIRGWLSVISPHIEFKTVLDKMADSSYATFDGHRANNVGFGLSYTLPVITALLIGTIIQNSLVVIENPEAHLHPKGQTEMARLIALCVKAGAQIIVETHSDHLFDGIRIAARQYKMAKDIQIYWFELDEDKNTKVYSPLLSDDGRIDEWPAGFFDQFEINSSQLI
jgi:predicted ATPase